MQNLPKDPSQFHHAYLVSGTKETSALLVSDLERLGIATRGNPDFVSDFVVSFGVDEAQALILQAATRPVRGDRKYFLVTASSISREAQNSLLKLLEEPTGSSVFFVVVPAARALLPTLRSRMHLLEYRTHDATAITLARTFLSDSFAERIELLKKFADERDTERVMSLLSELERILGSMSRNIAFADGLRAVWRARRHIAAGTASLKMMLEQVALLVPRVKAA